MIDQLRRRSVTSALRWRSRIQLIPTFLKYLLRSFIDGGILEEIKSQLWHKPEEIGHCVPQMNHQFRRFELDQFDHDIAKPTIYIWCSGVHFFADLKCGYGMLVEVNPAELILEDRSNVTLHAVHLQAICGALQLDHAT